mmetsp:Transcript_101738/g.296650  ORF Transcript_101738/g.296650 Transcript_101738/m.296650 type:complete len:249 (-) Transcript_101738:400-1146(-)
MRPHDLRRARSLRLQGPCPGARGEAVGVALACRVQAVQHPVTSLPLRGGCPRTRGSRAGGSAERGDGGPLRQRRHQRGLQLRHGHGAGDARVARRRGQRKPGHLLAEGPRVPHRAPVRAAEGGTAAEGPGLQAGAVPRRRRLRRPPLQRLQQQAARDRAAGHRTRPAIFLSTSVEQRPQRARPRAVVPEVALDPEPGDGPADAVGLLLGVRSFAHVLPHAALHVLVPGAGEAVDCAPQLLLQGSVSAL